jgi:hypothetical protein
VSEGLIAYHWIVAGRRPEAEKRYIEQICTWKFQLAGRLEVRDPRRPDGLLLARWNRLPAVAHPVAPPSPNQV